MKIYDKLWIPEPKRLVIDYNTGKALSGISQGKGNRSIFYMQDQNLNFFMLICTFFTN